MSAPAISVEGLGKRYVLGHQRRPDTLRDSLAQKFGGWFRGGPRTELEEFWALRDVSFAVQPGEVVGIIGRNGAGKSTLLKVLSRITEPTAGRAVIRGRIASLLEVGTGFHPELSGRENIFLNGAILGMTRAEIARKFDEIVAFAEVERFLDTPVKHYSSGMYVRLAFAVAAHLEPEILIVDEVLAVGDAAFQKKCLGKMQDVARGEGRTILFVSHNMSSVQSLCSRAIHLASGQVKAAGPAGAIVDHYVAATAGQAAAEPFAGRTLLPGLQLQALAFQPSSPPCLGAARFHLTLRAEMETSLADLALILSASTGQRAAILDLRRAEGRRILAGGQELTVRGEIPALTLVEGTYSVGLHLASAQHRADIEDLTLLQVAPAAMGANPRYAAAHRGFAEIPFRLGGDESRPVPPA